MALWCIGISAVIDWNKLEESDVSQMKALANKQRLLITDWLVKNLQDAPVQYIYRIYNDETQEIEDINKKKMYDRQSEFNSDSGNVYIEDYVIHISGHEYPEVRNKFNGAGGDSSGPDVLHYTMDRIIGYDRNTPGAIKKATDWVSTNFDTSCYDLGNAVVIPILWATYKDYESEYKYYTIIGKVKYGYIGVDYNGNTQIIDTASIRHATRSVYSNKFIPSLGSIYSEFPNILLKKSDGLPGPMWRGAWNNSAERTPWASHMPRCKAAFREIDWQFTDDEIQRFEKMQSMDDYRQLAGAYWTITRDGKIVVDTNTMDPLNITVSGVDHLSCYNRSLSDANIVSVEIKDSVLGMDDGLFKECTHLEKVVFNPEFQRVPDEAFVNCTKLSKVDFSKCKILGYIEESAFRGCTSLREVDLSKCDRLDMILSYAFYKSGLEKVKFPGGVLQINDNAFAYTNLEIADLSGVEKTAYIGLGAFANTPLKTLIYPKSIGTLSADGLFGANQLRTIVLPTEEIKHIEKLLYDDEEMLICTGNWSKSIPSRYIEAVLPALREIWVNKENERFAHEFKYDILRRRQLYDMALQQYRPDGWQKKVWELESLPEPKVVLVKRR